MWLWNASAGMSTWGSAAARAGRGRLASLRARRAVASREPNERARVPHGSLHVVRNDPRHLVDRNASALARRFVPAAPVVVVDDALGRSQRNGSGAPNRSASLQALRRAPRSCARARRARERRAEIDVAAECVRGAGLGCDLDAALEIRETSPVAQLRPRNADDVQRLRAQLVGRRTRPPSRASLAPGRPPWRLRR